MTTGMADSSQLSSEISLPFMSLEELTPRRIMLEVERVLQSHEVIVLGNDLHLNLIYVNMPSGSGNANRERCGVNLKNRMLRKQCFVTVKNKDELCAARAIVTAIARMEGFSNYYAYNRGRPIQRVTAWDFHHKAGVPLTSCGIEEIKLFQAVLPDYQLVVVSGDHFDATIYKGPETEKPVYLYYHSGHYDVITSMPAFIGRAYFCLKCEKGYNTEDWRHNPCTNKYRCCQHTACPNQGEISSWIICAQCHRMFKGP